MKTIAELKRTIKPGVKLATVNHILGTEYPARKVSHSDTVNFALATEQKDGSFKDSFMAWPKREAVRFEGANSFSILVTDYKYNSPTHGSLIPGITYTIIQ